MALAADRRRVLVLFEPGRGGGVALEEARELALARPTALTVVCVAPQAMSGARCGNSALDFNRAVADDAAKDLDEACGRLAAAGVGAEYQLLIDGAGPSLEQFAAAGEFELVLLPARRRPLLGPTHPAAPRLARVGGIGIRVVDSRRRAASVPARY